MLTVRRLNVKGLFPVSYTHLDVYKRQALALSFEANRNLMKWQIF
ncbi:hypothetical protein [Erwinia amylovora]